MENNVDPQKIFQEGCIDGPEEVLNRHHTNTSMREVVAKQRETSIPRLATPSTQNDKQNPVYYTLFRCQEPESSIYKPEDHMTDKTQICASDGKNSLEICYLERDGAYHLDTRFIVISYLKEHMHLSREDLEIIGLKEARNGRPGAAVMLEAIYQNASEGKGRCFALDSEERLILSKEGAALYDKLIVDFLGPKTIKEILEGHHKHYVTRCIGSLPIHFPPLNDIYDSPTGLCVRLIKRHLSETRDSSKPKTNRQSRY